VAKVLQDKVAVITGSGRGIGRAIALAMAKEGAKVITNDCDLNIAEAVTKEIRDAGGHSIACVADVSKFEEARKPVQAAVDNFGRLDILVNNAGTVAYHPVWEMPEADFDSLIAIHLKGSFNCIRHACAVMMNQKWGRIINTTSGGRLGNVENCNYASAKAGIVGLTRSVARDLGSYGITCNTYSPGGVATRMLLSDVQKARTNKMYQAGMMTKEFYDRVMNPPSPDTVPPLLIYLCSDKAAGVTGQVFDISGPEIRIFIEEIKSRIVKPEGLWTTEELEEQVPVLLKAVEGTRLRQI
jgi:3-oxoacyl-[acyl-carrier protein] reductase